MSSNYAVLYQGIRQCCSYPGGIEVAIAKNREAIAYEVVGYSPQLHEEVFRIYLAFKFCPNKSQIPLISVQLRSEFDSVQAVLEHLDIWAVDSSTVCTLYSGVRIVKITKPANMKPVIYAWRHPPAAPAAPAFKALRRKLSDRKRSKLAAQKRRGFPPLRTWQEQDSVQGDDCGDICVLTRTSTMETTDTSPSSPRQSSLRAQILRRIGAVLGINSRVLPTNTVDAY
jgi:hypothetical protein